MMPVEAMSNYYVRELNRDGSMVVPYGMEERVLKYFIVVDKDGNFINLERSQISNKNAKKCVIPRGISRSGTDAYKKANLLWDNYGYVLGQAKPGNKKAPMQLESFINRIESLPEELKNNEEILAVRKFYQNKDSNIKKVIKHPNWNGCYKDQTANLTFRLSSSIRPVAELPELKQWVTSQETLDPTEDEVIGECSVSGEVAPIARLHRMLGGFGQQAANLVSCQLKSGYDTHGLVQGYNAFISKKVEFQYTSALSMLVNSMYNKLRVGKVTYLFWTVPESLKTEVADDVESGFNKLFGFVSDKDDANLNVDAIYNTFRSIYTGKIPTSTGDQFYMAGIVANMSRLRIVCWDCGDIKSLARNIFRYFDDLKLVGIDKRSQTNVWSILRSSIHSRKVGDVTPHVVSSFLGSVLNGTRYPRELFNSIVNRIRSDLDLRPERIAFLKAYLNRENNNEVITVCLDKNRKNVAYRLGRLLAVAEAIEDKANHHINSSIKDRYYRSLSATPASAIQKVMELNNFHLKKLSGGLQHYYNDEIADIMSGFVDDIPIRMSIVDRANYSIGYYHEYKWLYTKKNTGIDSSVEIIENN